MELTDSQSLVLATLEPKPRLWGGCRDRPWREPCDVLNALLWVLRMRRPLEGLPGPLSLIPNLSSRGARKATWRS
jgi:hypothetical protein